MKKMVLREDAKANVSELEGTETDGGGGKKNKVAG